MHHLVSLAKEAVENYVQNKNIICPLKNLPEEWFERRAGAFVTIEKNGDLRGCIGTYLPTKMNIAEEIISNAIAAALEDYRFGPIQKKELPYLSYTVYTLSEPEPVTDIKKELDPKKYGIIVKTFPIAYPNQDVVFNGHVIPKTGLLLPDLKGVDTIEQQISIACQKGNIDPGIDKILIYRFTVKKYK